MNVEGDSNECKLRITSSTKITQVKLISSNGTMTFDPSSSAVFQYHVQDFFTSDNFVSQIYSIETTPSSVILNAELIFNSAGYISCLVMYSEKMTDSHISNAYLNKDSVISFFHKHVNVQATGEELNNAVSETYNQLANVSDANSAWVMKFHNIFAFRHAPITSVIEHVSVYPLWTESIRNIEFQ